MSARHHHSSHTYMETSNTNSNRGVDRRYLCTNCNAVVQARWFATGSFSIGCECTTVPVVPQMGQDETPNSWRVEREDCCADVEAGDLERVYEHEKGEYQCSVCGATYSWGGDMITPPDDDSDGRATGGDAEVENYGN